MASDAAGWPALAQLWVMYVVSVFDQRACGIS